MCDVRFSLKESSGEERGLLSRTAAGNRAYVVSWLDSNLPQLSYQQRMHRLAQDFDGHPKQMQQCLSGGKYQKGSLKQFHVAKHSKARSGLK